METIEHIVLSALLHDICKAYNTNDFATSNGHFCEILSKKFNILQKGSNQSDTDQWHYLTQNYYKDILKKDDQKTVLEQIISAADYFASAEREEGFQKNINKIKSNRLIPILERVDLKNETHPTTHKLPCTKLSLDREHIFPIDKNQPLKDETININEMIKDIESIPDFKKETHQNEGIRLRCITGFLLSIFEKYLSQVPANINTDTPDVSLYDHLRITAAIAEGLYEYHKDTNDLNPNAQYKNKDIDKWLLVCGDFSGIQNFIYKLTSKKAAKGLRGRSFYIQLLCDASAQYMIQKINLFPTSLIYSSGGKFYLLIPNTTHHISRLEKATDAVNSWLLTEFRGEMYLGIGYTKVSGKFFEAGEMGIKWKEANEALQKNRLHRFSSQILTSEDFFAPQELHSDNRVCQACSRNDSAADIQIETEEETDNKIQKCRHCRRLEEMGAYLTDTQHLLWAWNSDIEIECHRKYVFSFDDGMRCQLYFYKKRPDKTLLSQLSNYSLEIINNLDDPEGFGFRFIGKWQRFNDKVTEFDKFAEKAKGIHRLGILRMDVDNLGEIFVRGFDFLGSCDKQMGSLSRIATMSRQLNIFFSGYLNILIQALNHKIKDEKVQIIYSGGDDLFIIGSWDEIPELANIIQERFKEYCCHNPYFTLSAGISMVTGKYPIYHAAMLAGRDESRAKAIGEIFSDNQSPAQTDQTNQKNALCFMDTVIGWEDYHSVLEIKNLIEKIVKETKHRAIIEKLNTVVYSVNMFEKTKKSEKYSFDKIYELVCFQKWRWQLIYNLHRMSSKYSDDTIAQIEKLQSIILNLNNNTRLPVLSWLEMPVRWADFLTRKEGKKSDE